MVQDTNSLIYKFPSLNEQSLWLIGIQGIVILVFTLLVSILVNKALKKFANHIDQLKRPVGYALVKSSVWPASLFIWIMAFSWFLATAKPFINLPILQFVPIIQKIMIILLFSGFLHQSLRLFYKHSKKIGHDHLAIPTTKIEIIYKILQIAIIIVATLLLLQSLGISISGLLAFGGLGGLLVGFAARDTLANLFSGLMLYMDHPFRTGERIKISDQSIEGTVEHIGWRQTCVRNDLLQPIYIPNMLFSSAAVITPSRMFNRRILYNLGVRYSDFEHLPTILQDMRDYLAKNEFIDQRRPVRVHCIGYGAYSIDLQVCCYTITVQRDDFLNVQEQILLYTGKIIHKNGADFAFPTQTLHIQNNRDENDELS